MDLELKKKLWKQYYLRQKTHKEQLLKPPIESNIKSYFNKTILQNEIFCMVDLLEFEKKNEETLSEVKIYFLLPDEINRFCELFELSGCLETDDYMLVSVKHKKKENKLKN